MSSKIQTYIDALRTYDFIKFFEYADYLVEELNKMNSETGADNLVPLLIYELSQTDLSEEDIQFIQDLQLLFNENSNSIPGIARYAWTTFTLAFPFAVAVKSPATLEMSYKEFNDRFDDFQKENENKFNLLQEDIQIESNKINITAEKALHKLVHHLHLEELKEQYANTNEIQYMQGEIPNQNGVDNETFALHALAFQYQKYLENNKTDSEFYNNRLEAVERILAITDNKNKLSHDAESEIQKNLDIIGKNQPTWGERKFRYKMLDIVTLGIVPLTRSLKSLIFHKYNATKAFLTSASGFFGHPQNHDAAKPEHKDDIEMQLTSNTKNVH